MLLLLWPRLITRALPLVGVWRVLPPHRNLRNAPKAEAMDDLIERLTGGRAGRALLEMLQVTPAALRSSAQLSMAQPLPSSVPPALGKMPGLRAVDVHLDGPDGIRCTELREARHDMSVRACAGLRSCCPVLVWWCSRGRASGVIGLCTVGPSCMSAGAPGPPGGRTLAQPSGRPPAPLEQGGPACVPQAARRCGESSLFSLCAAAAGTPRCSLCDEAYLMKPHHAN